MSVRIDHIIIWITINIHTYLQVNGHMNFSVINIATLIIFEFNNVATNFFDIVLLVYFSMLIPSF